MSRFAGPWAVLAIVLAAGCERDHFLGSEGDAAPSDAGSETGADAGEDVLPDALPSYLTVLPIPARHLVFDPKGQRLFASVGGAPGPQANSLVVIDAATGQAVDSIPVGSEPGSLAISDDGSTLWVGLDGAGTVRKVDLTGARPAPGPSFSLPTTCGYLTIAGPMWVLQGSATTLAVSMRCPNISPAFAGVAIFDDGVAREMKAAEHSGASRLVRGPPGWLFGYNDQDTGYGFFSLPVTTSGVTEMLFDGLVDGFPVDIVYAGGRVYATTGPVIDVGTPTAPMRAGAFSFAGAIAPVPEKQRAFMASPAAAADAEPKAWLRVLDLERFTQVSATELPTLTDVTFTDLVRISDTRVAFIAGQNFQDLVSRIVLVRVDQL